MNKKRACLENALSADTLVNRCSFNLEVIISVESVKGGGLPKLEGISGGK